MNRLVLSTAAGASLGVAVALRAVLRVPVLDTSPGVSPGLLTTLPPPLVTILCVLLGAGLGLFVGRSRLAPALAPLGLLVLAAGIYVPGLFQVAPFLALFSGTALDFVLVGVVLAVAWKLVAMRTSPVSFSPRTHQVGIVAFLLFAVVGLKIHEDVGLSGDEPHYLLITYSVLEDGDLRVQNNYFQEDHQLFYRGKIGPHLATGTEYSIHGVGLPLLLVPGYAFGGLIGVVLTLALLAALLVATVFDTALRLTESAPLALVAAFLFGATSPALFLSVSAYPELPAALIVMVSLWRFTGPRETSWGGLGWAVLIGTLPFFHMKFIPLMLVLWGATALRLNARRGLIAGCILSGVTLMAFFYLTTGSIDPTASYGRQRVFLSSIPTGLLGLVFDQEFGLLPAAPFYLIGLVGLVSMVRRHSLIGLVSVAVVAAVALPGAAHPLWSGGNSPPARFLFPALPLVAIAAVVAWQKERDRGVLPWFPTLAMTSLCVSWFTLVLPGQPLYLNQKDGTGRLWEVLSDSWDLPSYLPSVVTGDARSMMWVGIGAVALLLAFGLQLRSRSVRLPPWPLLAFGFLWVQDLSGVTLSRAMEGRWVSSWMRAAAANLEAGALALPSYERLPMSASLEQLSLPLVLRASEDGQYWSRPYSLPAGHYRLSGGPIESWAPCNDATCFAVAEGAGGFTTEVGLSRFQLRAPVGTGDLRLELERGAAAGSAERSLILPDGAKLHGLDDHAYLDRRGYWVKRGARAAFVLETGSKILVRNGGAGNYVVVHHPGRIEFRDMRPFEEWTLHLPPERRAVQFSVESESGFRPSQLDPDSADHRELGVFVTTPRF